MFFFFIQSLPSFGPYQKQKEDLVAKAKKENDLLGKESLPPAERPANKPSKPLPKVKVVYQVFMYGLILYMGEGFFTVVSIQILS